MLLNVQEYIPWLMTLLCITLSITEHLIFELIAYSESLTGNLATNKWRFYVKKETLCASLNLKMWAILQLSTRICKVLFSLVLGMVACEYNFRRILLVEGRTQWMVLHPTAMELQQPISNSFKGCILPFTHLPHEAFWVAMDPMMEIMLLHSTS